MAEVYEYFDVYTEGGRNYFVEALNIAYAAHRIEYEFQERVISVYTVKYHKLVLIGEQHAPETADPQSTSSESTALAPSTGTEGRATDTAHEPEADREAGTCQEDVRDSNS